MSEPLPVGQMAPDFTLTSSAPNTPDGAGDKCQTVSLRDYRGKNVVLVFYPADWSSVCGDELAIYSELTPVFQTLNAQVLGVSVDGVHSHQAFVAARGFQMPLLSDFEPKGEVARSFGVYDEQNGFCERALFVVDAQGTVRYSFVSPRSVNPGAGEVLKTLKAIESGENHV